MKTTYYTPDGAIEFDDDNYVNTYDSIITLDEAKAIKINNINNNTDLLIAGGVEYNDSIFGFELHDQINYLGMNIMQDCLTFPLTIKCRDEGTFYTFESKEDAVAFTEAVCAWKNSLLNSGWLLKYQVLACESIQSVCEISDTRL